MRVLTSDLHGAALNWAVAEAFGIKVEYQSRAQKVATLRSVRPDGDFSHVEPELSIPGVGQAQFDKNWAQGGPLFDSEGVMLHADLPSGVVAYLRRSGTSGVRASGPTALVAAMRCIVTSKKGREVDIPDVILLDQGFVGAGQDARHMEPEGKVITVVAEAYATCEHAEAPSFAVYQVDQASLERVKSLAEMADRNGLSMVSLSGYPDWGPGDIDNDLRLQNAGLVVVPRGAFWFTDYPKHGSFNIETRICEIDALQRLFDEASDSQVVFLTEDEKVQAQYAEEEHSAPMLAFRQS